METSAFIDHGVGAAVAESRGVVATEDAGGRSLVIALSLDLSPEGSILVTDIDAGTTEQYYYPEGVPNSPPYASLMSENGRFYTFAGSVLLEFSLESREWSFHGVPAADEMCYTGSAMADGPDGRIYGCGHPNCHLVSFDPETKEMTDHGQMDPEEHYPTCLEADPSGWLYLGIGTARCNIVAYNPATGERRQIIDEEERELGTGYVYLGEDDKCYGRACGKWYRMSGGEAEVIAENEAVPAVATGAIAYSTMVSGGDECQATGRTFTDGRQLRQYNMPDRWLDVEDKDGDVERIEFEYDSGGSAITSLIAAPDGMVYASTCHPLHFVAYNAKIDVLEDWGPIERLGGGNFCAMALQGKYWAGAAYCGGFLYLYDTTQPWNGETGDAPNPRLVAQYEGDIERPRTMLAHPDGMHVLVGGFMGYGMTGGGIALYNVETGASTLLTHRQVIPDQSTITLKALPNGDVVGGTSVTTPGGGHAAASEGVLYVMDWEATQVVFQTVPVPGAEEVFSIEVGPDGLVYGAASGAQFFVFDPTSREIVHREDMAHYGDMPREVLVGGPDGNLYAIFTEAIVRIEPTTFAHERLAEPPERVTAGVSIYGGRLYYACGSHLWSCGLGIE